METGLILLLAMVVIYALFSMWLGKSSVTMPMVFVAVGALFGNHALGWIDFSISTTSIEMLVEVTLGLLLFADASSLNFNQVRDDASLPARLLLIVLPLVILLGGLIAFIFFPEEGIGFAFLIATILAPTDAALGLPIFNNPRVPIRIRRALNVESGLNDGIATPLVTIFIALGLTELSHSQHGFLFSSIFQITIGFVVGIGLGLLGGWLFATAKNRRWASPEAMQIGNPALVLLIYLIARDLRGNSFVAVFVAGLLFGYVTRHRLHEATEYTEVTGTLLSAIVWAVFGSTLVVPLLANFKLLALLYGLLSLTVVRMIAVAIGLIGKRFRPDTVLMMGWLGPRGLASVVFLIMANEAALEAQVSANQLIGAVAWTILLSVVLHGISALPLAKWYGSRMKKADPGAAELVGVQEIHLGRRRTFAVSSHKSES